MPKATVTVRFKLPSDPTWLRRPAVLGTTGRVRSRYALSRIASAGTPASSPSATTTPSRFASRTARPPTSPPRDGSDALAKLRSICARLEAKKTTESLGLIVLDLEDENEKLKKKKDQASKTPLMTTPTMPKSAAPRRARERALLVKSEFLGAFKVT